jgi:hypothetical protein
MVYFEQPGPALQRGSREVIRLGQSFYCVAPGYDGRGPQLAMAMTLGWELQFCVARLFVCACLARKQGGIRWRASKTKPTPSILTYAKPQRKHCTLRTTSE